TIASKYPKKAIKKVNATPPIHIKALFGFGSFFDCVLDNAISTPPTIILIYEYIRIIVGGVEMALSNTQSKKEQNQNKALMWIGGVAFTFFIAFLGYLLAMVPGFDRVGQLATAIVIAVIFRQIFGYPEAIRSGIAFSSKRLLRAAIILYGLKLNIDTVLSD